MSPPIFLVCGTIRGLDAEQALCSECEATIWPTAGSLKRAEAEEMLLICIGCYGKMDDTSFGGFMHHGAMLPEALGERLFVECQLAMIQAEVKRT